MNSLQILSILNLENIVELKEILIPRKFYALNYSSSDHAGIDIYTSKYLYEHKQDVTVNIIQLIRNLKKNHEYLEDEYPSCKNCSTDKSWSLEELIHHFVHEKHFEFLSIIYKIKEFEIL